MPECQSVSNRLARPHLNPEIRRRRNEIPFLASSPGACYLLRRAALDIVYPCFRAGGVIYCASTVAEYGPSDRMCPLPVAEGKPTDEASVLG